MKQNQKLSYMILIFSLVIIITIIQRAGYKSICLFKERGKVDGGVPKEQEEGGDSDVVLENAEECIAEYVGPTQTIFIILTIIYVILLGLNFFRQKYTGEHQLRLYKVIHLLTMPIIPISLAINVLFHFAHKWAFQIFLFCLIALIAFIFIIYTVFDNEILRSSYFYIIGIILFFIILFPLILFFGEKQEAFQTFGSGFGALFGKLKNNFKSIVKLISGVGLLILSLYGYVNFSLIRTILHIGILMGGLLFVYKKLVGEAGFENVRIAFRRFVQTFTNEVNITQKSVFLVLLIEIILLILYFLIPALANKEDNLTKGFDEEIANKIATNKKNISEMEKDLTRLKESSFINKIKRLLFHWETYYYELPMENWADEKRSDAWDFYIEGYKEHKEKSDKKQFIRDVVGKLGLPDIDGNTLWTRLGIKTMTKGDAITHLEKYSPIMENISTRIKVLQDNVADLEKENPVFETIYIAKEPVRLDSKTTVITDGLMNTTSKVNYGFAISMWIYIYSKLKQEEGDKTIFKIGETEIGLTYNRQPDGEPLVFTYPTSSHAVPKSSKLILLQKWNNIIINYDTEHLDIFINGVLCLTLDSIIIAPNRTQQGPVYLGENEGLYGAIKDVIYYPVPLNYSKIEAISNKKSKCEVSDCEKCISPTKCSICDSGYSLREDLTCMKDPH